ncbi:ferrous iron transport protein B [Pseudoflavonifractor phocaeensis]|uniref:ferrous iron transport protein B n=1 Tax=Pseudoflavonifractor phocaeensis TaxID=1870988 RepID=UPI00195BDB07|nr:ferrous iron transport protein B [Pseudoflavonifractor phocaeensis]MBM6869884.1 ferrous iron transport protein B [Pseudoflavonifractor phocaeensis]
MSVTIALAGNPNCGKTTMFNDLTGSAQYVGNWPGVTVEKKDGRLKGRKDVTIQDLPGIYSLSPYTLEEVVARGYLVKERPDAILNILDGTNIERNLYLTTQLIELGLPVVVAVNMMDVVRKNGDQIDLKKLGKELGCTVVAASALKGEGSMEAAQAAVQAAERGAAQDQPAVFTGSVEHAIAHIEESIEGRVDRQSLRWYAIKLFERDEKVREELGLEESLLKHIDLHIQDCEKEMDDDAESIITNQRYAYISQVVDRCVKKKRERHGLTTSDKIDRVVTNRILALPIFVAVMVLVYSISMGGWAVSIGTRATDWANDGLFGDGWFVPFTADTEAWEEDSGAFEEASAMIAGYEAGDAEVYFYDDETGETTVVPVTEEAYQSALTVAEPDPNAYGTWVPGLPVLAENALTAVGCNEVLQALILDGIIGGVGAVLGFVPQMLVLFLLLAILEDCGYMARIAFIMDRIFRRFGLSGKSFIPMLVATGCGVPGIMASRTIEQDRDRKMTIMTTGFIPCGAKMPIIALFAGALFGGSALVATSAYFIGVAAVVISGIILKKTKAFAGEPAPFVMELPAYHAPTVGNVLRATWERGWSFIKRAGTVILASSIVLWFLQGFGFTDGGFGMVADNNDSLLAAVGHAVSFVFLPLGFGTWQAAVATVTGLIAKEEVVSTFGVLFPGNLTAEVGMAFTPIAAYSFMIFNLLCAPCFAAMGAIKREMNNPKWALVAIGYMCLFAYGAALVVYQIGGLIAGTVGFGPGTVVAAALVLLVLYLMVRPNKYNADYDKGATLSVRLGKGVRA